MLHGQYVPFTVQHTPNGPTCSLIFWWVVSLMCQGTWDSRVGASAAACYRAYRACHTSSGTSPQHGAELRLSFTTLPPKLYLGSQHFTVL